MLCTHSEHSATVSVHVILNLSYLGTYVSRDGCTQEACGEWGICTAFSL